MRETCKLWQNPSSSLHLYVYTPINNASIFITTLLVSLVGRTGRHLILPFKSKSNGEYGWGQRSGWGVASLSLCTRDPSSSSCCCWALSRSSSLRRSRDSSLWCCSSCGNNSFIGYILIPSHPHTYRPPCAIHCVAFHTSSPLPVSSFTLWLIDISLWSHVSFTVVRLVCFYRLFQIA